jgi:hypothetical protein
MNVRKNIIIEDALWDFLAEQAEARGDSISQLITDALKKTYKADDVYARRIKADQEVMLIKEGHPKVPYNTDFKKLAHEDHKY